MAQSDSEEEFYDAVDDSASTPWGNTPASLSFSFASAEKRGTAVHRRTDIAIPDFSALLALSPVPMDSPSPSFTPLFSPASFPSPPFPSTFSTKLYRKDTGEFSALSPVQELKTTASALILTCEFSPNGFFLATAGEEGLIRIYEIAFSNGLLCPTPYRVYREHGKSVTGLAWSADSGSLLSVGSEKTLVVWQLDSLSPVKRLSHPDIVISAAFFPLSSLFCVSGCGDRLIRIWNIHTGRVTEYYQVADYITTLAYKPSGRWLFVGLRKGIIVLYSVLSSDSKLKYISELRCRNRRGPKSGGRAVTKIVFYDEETFLVTTNDSRIRLYTGDSMEQKYKGLQNENSPIGASFSQNLVHVICGSETGTVYIWNTYNTFLPSNNPKCAVRRLPKSKRNRNKSYESFLGSSRVGIPTIVAQFAPQKVLRTLQEHTVHSNEVISHVLITAGAEGVLRVYFNVHRRV